MVCDTCGRLETAQIICPAGHYICNTCHDADFIAILPSLATSTPGADPVALAEAWMNHPTLPMLGCQHAHLAARALAIALQRSGVDITSGQMTEVHQRISRQAIGGFCGYTGVCGIAPAIGAVFSVLLDAACPKDQETASVMKVVGQIVLAIADETGPCCCKAFVRTALRVSTPYTRQLLGIPVTIEPAGEACTYVNRHPHGCRKERCAYYGLPMPG